MSRKIIVNVSLMALVAGLMSSVVFAQASSRSQEAIEKAQAGVVQSAQSASDRANQIENKATSTSLRVRAEVCEQKRTRLQTVARTMYQGAESVKTTLDTAYGRITAFYDKGQLTVANYQQYVDKIELAKQEATAAMGALQQRENSDIDCADAKTSARLEGDRLAGEGTKTALKQYRTELVNLISALKSEAAAKGLIQ